MNAVVAMVGRLQGVFSKTFLSAGLLPALVLFFGWIWYSGGLGGVENFFHDFTVGESDGSSTSESVPLSQSPEHQGSVRDVVDIAMFRTAVAIAVGLLFFAVRQVVLDFFQTLRCPGFGRFREWKCKRQEWKTREVEYLSLQKSYEYTAVRWPDDEFATQNRRPPADYDSESFSQIKRKSQRAIRVIQSIANRDAVPRLSASSYRKIRDGLVALYEYTIANPTRGYEWRPELAHWKTILSEDGRSESFNRAVYYAALVRAKRFSAEAAATTQEYPTADWIMPTKLGMRLLALDEYGKRRYNVDTTTIWPRMWGLLSAEEKSEVTDAQVAVTSLLNLSVALLLLSSLIAGRCIWHGLGSTVRWHGIFQKRWQQFHILRNWPHDLWRAAILFHQAFSWRSLGFIALSLWAARLAYQAGIVAATAFSERVIRYVDLYWLRLLDALGYKIPSTAGAAFELYKKLGLFLTAAYTREDGIAKEAIHFDTAKTSGGHSAKDSASARNTQET